MDTAELKVLALATDAFGGYGGIARSTQDMLLALARSGRVSAIEILPRLAAHTVGNLPLPIRQHSARSGRIAYTAVAAALTMSIRPHLIYCGHLFMAPMAARLARYSGAKLAVHLHGIEIWHPLSSFRRKGLERADIALCVSNDTAKRVLAATKLASESTAVVYNTVDEAFSVGDRVAARRSFGLSDETVLLTVSRLDARQRHKGHDRVISLLPQLRADNRKLLYFIAGEGADQERLRTLAEAHGVGAQVRFLGRVPTARLPDLYRAADVYAMPSSGEGFGIAFVEAMACGTPTVGLALGGAPDALGHGALGTCVSQDAFPSALADLLARPAPDRMALSRAARDRFGRAAFEHRIACVLDRLFPTAARALAPHQAAAQ